MLCPWARHFIRIASVDSTVKWVPGWDNLVKDVQWYEPFGGIALKNHTFFSRFFNYLPVCLLYLSNLCPCQRQKCSRWDPRFHSYPANNTTMHTRRGIKQTARCDKHSQNSSITVYQFDMLYTVRNTQLYSKLTINTYIHIMKGYTKQNSSIFTPLLCNFAFRQVWWRVRSNVKIVNMRSIPESCLSTRT